MFRHCAAAAVARKPEAAVHREDGRLNYAGELSFQNVIDASLVHEAAASLK
jgi:hypothetical protein